MRGGRGRVVAALGGSSPDVDPTHRLVQASRAIRHLPAREVRGKVVLTA
ncbi:MAG: hypothetical protein WBL35_11200 [Ornithinibacter sp.]